MLRPKMYMNGHLMVHYQDLIICVDWISKLATTTGHCYIGPHGNMNKKYIYQKPQSCYNTNSK